MVILIGVQSSGRVCGATLVEAIFRSPSRSIYLHSEQTTAEGSRRAVLKSSRFPWRCYAYAEVSEKIRLELHHAGGFVRLSANDRDCFFGWRPLKCEADFPLILLRNGSLVVACDPVSPANVE